MTRLFQTIPDVGGPAQPLLSVRRLVKHFPLGQRGLPFVGRARHAVHAVDGVSFDIQKGETLGVVGESGCGKSTTARLLMQLLAQDSGELVFDGQTVGSRELPLREFRRQVQMVFQDSFSSLNPRMTIEDSIAFGATVHGVPAKQAIARGRDLLARVGLDPVRFAGRYPHELSGGQRQRVNIARALALEPRLVILDEAVSALDKSVEAQVLNLLADLKADFGLTYVFISHDLNVVRYMSDRVVVMYLGEVVEVGSAESVFDAPRHPYTRALLQSMPSVDPLHRTTVAPLSGDPPNPVDPPTGCRFHTRCPQAREVCGKRAPLSTKVNGGTVRCLAWERASGYAPEAEETTA
ncbi:ABC transporter ATP-binding protein [Paraburkholderia caballeronis]|uniref:ABC transporter ATP-binding protein n=1 Tax=Paraburkholderia caballeronis TaxID=416943 RepID=UPI00106651A6|nr:ABC transporter ATP-binding protein [Paraburkholderia caballeronis]TDV11759.1 peptide/nickel transport system ATP-binding protein [Paraburkholderia caballeronis]TDV14840.1 peptide/nickel transport system ATP-binding protein [Paraburkholderia caballeronis]TDV23960.1 peptide/nickel transport system ATP-binding protein [Paraburkholderia caballeronis]